MIKAPDPNRPPDPDCPLCGGDGIGANDYGFFDFSANYACPSCWEGEDASLKAEEPREAHSLLTCGLRSACDEVEQLRAENAKLVEWAAAIARLVEHAEQCIASLQADTSAFHSPGVEAIAAERRRQIEREGWTPEHDDQYRDGELWEAALCYARDFGSAYQVSPPPSWPWDAEWWKPGTRERNLEKAGALMAAEFDRIKCQQAAGRDGGE